MLIIIMTGDEPLLSLDVAAEEEIYVLKQLIESQSGISAAEITLTHNDSELTSGTLSSKGVADNDIIYLIRKPARQM